MTIYDLIASIYVLILGANPIDVLVLGVTPIAIDDLVVFTIYEFGLWSHQVTDFRRVARARAARVRAMGFGLWCVSAIISIVGGGG